ncbi:hypothetical protein [Plantactinospora sp. WMMB782]|uniref:hypothetical protein n=1 Tax=Plantactinospora sp. WMMB782 TaxID=3404121 RepID=UPI003B94E9F3
MAATTDVAYTTAAAFLSAHGAPPASIDLVAERVARFVADMSPDMLTRVAEMPVFSPLTVTADETRLRGIVPSTAMTAAAIQAAAAAVADTPTT